MGSFLGVPGLMWSNYRRVSLLLHCALSQLTGTICLLTTGKSCMSQAEI